MMEILLKPMRLLFGLNFLRHKSEEDNVFSVDDIYMTLSEAKVEVWKRWNDVGLRKKIDKYLNGNIPECFQDGPKAVLARHIASPNNEFVRYLDLAKMSELEPVCLEYLADKFRAENEDKYYLGKLIFFNKSGKKSHENRKVKKIINFDSSEGVHLSKVETINGKNIIEFHHDLLECLLDNHGCKILDTSDWIKANGKNPAIYYEKFFTLFLCSGILFEDYLENKNEKRFTHEIILPSFSEVYRKFGLKPIVVRLHHADKDHALHARAYDEKVLEFVK